jgi:hypothetical protein
MLATTQARYLDLLRVPYARRGFDPATGLNCFGMLLEWFRRRGYPEPALPWGSSNDALENAALAWAQDPTAWTWLGSRVGAAGQIDDVAVTRSEFAPLGCAVLVSLRPKLFLTSLPGRGGILLKPRQIEGSVTSVVRRARP